MNENEADEIKFYEKLKQILNTWKKEKKISKNTFQEIILIIKNETTQEEEKTTFSYDNYINEFMEGVYSILGLILNSLKSLFEPMLVNSNKNKNLDSEIISTDNEKFSGVGIFNELERSFKQNEFESNLLWKGIKPLFNEYIWWFIGTVLILTGSIMGIREAFVVLTGTGKLITILFSILLYQFLFVGLGIFISRKSIITGKILGIISIILIPISYSFLGTSINENLNLGIGLFVFQIFGSIFLFLALSKLFESSFSRLALPILPSMIVISFLRISTNPLLDILLLFIPLIILLMTFKESIEIKKKSILISAIYGVVVVIIIFLNEINQTEEIIFRMGSIQLGLLFLWILGFCFILIYACEGYKKIGDLRFYGAFEIVLLSICITISSASIMYLYDFENNNKSMANVFYLLAPAFTILQLIYFLPKHKQAIHPLFFLCIGVCFVLARSIDIPQISLPISVCIPILSIYLRKKFQYLENEFIYWCVSTGSIVSLLLLFSVNSLPILLFGICFSCILHFAFIKERTLFHLAGGFGILLFSKVILFLFLNSQSMYLIFAFSSLLYLISGIIYESILGDRKNGDDFLPFDDLSIVFSIFAVFFFFLFPEILDSLNAVICFLFAFVLLIRAKLDKTIVFSFLGMNILSLTLIRFFVTNYIDYPVALLAFSLGFISLITSLISVIIPRQNSNSEIARKIFFVIRLPFPSNNFQLIRHSSSLVSVLYFFASLWMIIIWLGIPDFPERNIIIQAGLVLTLISCISFFTNSISFIHLKGHASLFALIFICIGFTAITNRIGRPLPPMIVGRNLTIIILGLYLLSIFFDSIGAWLSTLLENATQGRYYRYVVLVVMLLLGVVLIFDVILLKQYSISRFLYITPPTFFFGAGLSFFLFYTSIPKSIFLHFALGSFIFSFAIGFAESSFLGTNLLPLNPPGADWTIEETFARTNLINWLNPSIFLPDSITPSILILKSTTGISIIGFLFAIVIILLSVEPIRLFAEKFLFTNLDSQKLFSIFSFWSVVCSLLLAIIAFQYAFLYAAYISLLTGILLRIPRMTRAYGSIILFLSGLILLEGIIHRELEFPFYGGIIHAFIGLFFVISIRPILKFFKNPSPRIFENISIGMIIYSFIGILYSLATGMIPQIDNAIPVLLSSASWGISGLWLNSISLGLTFLIISISFFVSSIYWKDKAKFSFSFLGSLLLLISIFTIFPRISVLIELTKAEIYSIYPNSYWGYYGLLFSSVGFIFFNIREKLKESNPEISDAFYLSSDILILLTGFFLLLNMNFGFSSSLKYSDFASLFSILIIILHSFWASYKNLQPRHLYFLQTSVLGLYISMKPIFPNILTPQLDSIIALITGFLLIGITSFADKKKIPSLSESTKKFAALMPLIAFFILPKESNYQNAGFAFFSAILYSTLGQVSSNKLYSVLGAMAANFALYTAISTNEIQGIEIYLAPIGLFTLLLGHIFRENLNNESKQILRLAGGLLLYLPSVIKISFDIGMGVEPMYSILFGVVCLIGIIMGMFFEIKSYVYMGTIFFVSNVFANLLQEGFRNQRVGFILLSTAGLSIIGSLILFTLKKELILGYISKARSKMSNWD